jgi:hypothetical protein
LDFCWILLSRPEHSGVPLEMQMFIYRQRRLANVRSSYISGTANALNKTTAECAQAGYA